MGWMDKWMDIWDQTINRIEEDKVVNLEDTTEQSAGTDPPYVT